VADSLKEPMLDFLYYAGIVAVMVLSFRFLTRRNRDRAVQHLPIGKADAARVGWEFEIDHTALFEIVRWRGTTSGLTWVAEGLRSGRQRNAPNRSVTRIIRWYTRCRLQVSSPVAILQVRDGQELPAPLPVGDGALAALAGPLVAGVLARCSSFRTSVSS
jgi:hypothetical protein